MPSSICAVSPAGLIVIPPRPDLSVRVRHQHALDEFDARLGFSQPVDPYLRSRQQHVRDGPAHEMRHLLDRPPEHEVFEPQLARQSAVVAVERGREQPLVDDMRGLAGRDQAVVGADAQRVVAVGRLQAAGHGEVLPRAADADDLDPRSLTPRVSALQLALEHGQRLRIRARRLLQHRVVGGAFGVEARRRAAPDELAGRHQRHAGRRSRAHLGRPRPRQHRDHQQHERGDLQDLPERRQSVIGYAREQHGPRNDAERTRGHGGEPPGHHSRDALAHVVGEQLAGEQGECGDHHERAVDRPAEQADARHVLEGERIDRRVAAQRVEQRHQQHGGHHPVGAPQHSPAGDAEPEHRRWSRRSRRRDS